MRRPCAWIAQRHRQARGAGPVCMEAVGFRLCPPGPGHRRGNMAAAKGPAV